MKSIALQVFAFLVLSVVVLSPTPNAGGVLAQEGAGDLRPVAANGDWEPVIQEFDGVEMVLVPPGCFLMGSTNEQIDSSLELCDAAMGEGYCQREWFKYEFPQHEICSDKPFWIDRYEVTNGQFADFDGVAAARSIRVGETLPRENITWFEARDFCVQRGARLPTEAEWEYAARGPDSLRFPWGNEFDGTRVNFCDAECDYYWADASVADGHTFTAPVGAYPDGVSWVGAHDMSGNLWECTSTIFGIDPERDLDLRGDVVYGYPYDPADGREDAVADGTYYPVMRGGSWGDFGQMTNATFRHGIQPDLRDRLIGIRCARDYDIDG